MTALLYLLPGEWDHAVLWLELLELMPFMYFWTVQTFEHWKVGLATHANAEAA